MTIFKKGMRVRIVRVSKCQEALGREAVLTGWNDNAHTISGSGFAGWELEIDGIGPMSGGIRYCFPPEYLEPIIPSGHCPSEYSFTELMDKCRAGEVENA